MSLGGGTLEILIEKELEIRQVQQANVLEVIAQGPPGRQGIPGEGSQIDILVTDAFIPAHSPITVDGHLADSNDLTHWGKVVGITMFDATAGTITQVAVTTELDDGSWSWSPGTLIYLNGTTLSATPAASGFSQRLAVARNANTIVVQMEPPILL